MSRSRIVVIGFAVCLLSAGGLFAAEFTYIDLVSRLTDLEQLATLPVPGETCRQWSSYDRASKYDAASGKYVNWFANGDGGGIIRKEGDQLVFAEMEGPGVIWRIWSALAKDGHVKIYLDGRAEPVVDLPFVGYFNRENEPFTHEALVHMTARGQNCYVPIPFQKSCKIVAEGDWGAYYHFTYTTYPKGTVLPTFTRQLSAVEKDALAKAAQALAQRGFDPAGERIRQKTVKETVKVTPDSTATVAKINGPRAITALKAKMDLPESPDDRNILRRLVLKIRWDGEKQPSVCVPLGDFFGTAPGVNNYESLPLGMSEDGFYSYWYMPFAKSGVVELVNDGNEPQKVDFSITHAPLTKPIKTLGRFHAKWHRDAFLPEEPERDSPGCVDWTMLKTQGRGRFCGVMLHVWNPRGGWWGEGDEKFFVDGEKFPSTIGTGSEDYFGYAWCNPELFQNCYHNQTISMNNKGHVSVNRWHITDNIPFQQSFEGAIEKYYPNSKPTLYAATAYWYQAAGQTDPYEPAPVTQRLGYWGPIQVFRIKGAIEGEKLKVLSKTGGGTQTQDMSGFGQAWSEEAHLWWTGAKTGDTLELAVPVAKAGTYRLKTQLTKAVDYGIVQLYLNGEKLGDSIDLFNNGVIATGQIDLGVHKLDKGQAVLKAEIVGANEKAVKAYMVGLDYVLLEEGASAFYLPEDPKYTILDSAQDSVRFAEGTLVPFDGRLACKSSFVDQAGDVMGWHDFGNLEGPGWAANAVGGAYELYSFAGYSKNGQLAEKALLLLDHVLEDGFIDYNTGFITGYRLTTTGEYCLNYQHKNNWFCPGSMAKIAYQMLIFSDLLEGPRKDKMRQAALKNAIWIEKNVKPASNGWFPRRCLPSGEHHPNNAYGDRDILFEKSADGIFIVQLMAELTKKGLADYTAEIRKRLEVFMAAGGIFGSINHDTYDHHESVAYAVAFRVMRQAAKLLDDKEIEKFAYEKCLAGLDRFKMTDDRNGVQTKGLLWMEKSWDTAYLWENAEAALAYFEAYTDTNNEKFLRDGLTILRAIAKHHHGDKGFLTEGVDWNNHVGKQHHFNEAEFGDIKYTEPLLNNLHIVEPTLFILALPSTVL
ncbi:MAG: DUF2961 domain-containing protein [Sedimentisphaerales bacterium]|nr:DUF2961 domain-containing protein [Sedimentisphaerales bacterium]